MFDQTLEQLQITDAKLYVLIVTLSTKDNIKLAKKINDAFKRSIVLFIGINIKLCLQN